MDTLPILIKSDNNTTEVVLDKFTLFYSYATIVAYQDSKDGLVCSKNIWSNTTGKHLNKIQPDKSKRFEHEIFSDMLKKALDRHINEK